MQRMQSFLISVKTLNMHKPLCIRTLIESISGIKIEIIQQNNDDTQNLRSSREQSLFLRKILQRKS